MKTTKLVECAKFTIILVAVSLLAFNIVFIPVHASGNDSMYVSPAGANFTVGSNISFSIMENSNTDSVNSVQTTVTFSSAQFQYVSIAAVDFPTGFNSTPSGNSVNFSGGSTSALTGVHVAAVLTLHVINSGSPTLSLSSICTGTTDSTCSALLDSSTNLNDLAVISGGSYSTIPATTSCQTATDRMMIIDNSSHAYSNDYLCNNWISQVTSATATAIAIGANGRMMVMVNGGSVYAKDSPTAAWIQQIGSGAQAIAVGGNGRMMVIDSAGNVYTKDQPTDVWHQETGGGGVKAIACGGNGRQLIIDSAGNTYEQDGIGYSWVPEVGGGISSNIAIGANGRMMVMVNGGSVYAKDSPTAAWIQQIGSGAQAIAVGGNGRMMVIDSALNAYYKDALTAGWSPEFGNNAARAIAVGNNGRMVVTDIYNEAWGKDQPNDNWTPLTSPTGAVKFALQ